MSPRCDVCGRELADWNGNVMVPSADFFNGNVSALEVICKACTKDLDSRGVGQEWHQMWELTWLQGSPIWALGVILADLADDEPRRKWSKQAIERVFDLVAAAHPGLATGPLEKWQARLEQ